MSYNFADTKKGGNSSSLPNEAICFNGKWLDEEIPQFRTLSVSGRELLGKQLNVFEVGRSDGNRFNYSRRSNRIVTVNYQILSNSDEEYREAFYMLNKLLAKDNAEFYFLDDEDKKWTGTLSEVGEVASGGYNAISSFSLECPLPFALGREKTFKTTTNSLEFRNNGNYKSYPVFKFKMKSKNGKVKIVNNANGGILQFGKTENISGETPFKEFDILEIDTRNKEIYLNANKANRFHTEKNEWNKFGLNGLKELLTFEFSQGATLPEIEVLFREAYI